MCCEPILKPSLTIVKPSCAILAILNAIQNVRFVETMRVSNSHVALPYVITNRHLPS